MASFEQYPTILNFDSNELFTLRHKKNAIAAKINISQENTGICFLYLILIMILLLFFFLKQFFIFLHISQMPVWFENRRKIFERWFFTWSMRKTLDWNFLFT